jgi:pilus assembly protein Flp/PilA
LPARAAAGAAQIKQPRRCRNCAPHNGASESVEDSMSMLLNFLTYVVREEEGQDLLEYALLVALIALIAIGAVGAAGGSVSTIFNNIATQLNATS